MTKLSRTSQYRAIPALIALLALVGSPAFVQAQPLGSAPPASADPDAVLVEELVVMGRLPGPAWWTVADADTTVHVLGVPSLAPKRMEWDRAIFERRLQGANALVLPFNNIRTKGIGVVGAGLNLIRLRSGGRFEARLDPPTRARFVAVREGLGQPAKHYPTANPLAAGVQLAGDYREAKQLTTTDPAKLVELLARRAGVPVVEKTYDIGPLLGAILRTSPAVGRVCFDEVLAQAEAGPGLTLAAARAWARGDVRGALENERTYERCLAMVPGGRAFDERMKADTAAAIRRQLETPGHAIVLVPLRPLLAQGGVLDRLQAEGVEVRTPGEASPRE
jgi:hypothetical protein